MRVLAYTVENLPHIAEAQGLPYDRVREVYLNAKKLDPKNVYFAMANFEPHPKNPNQKIEYIREDHLKRAFEFVDETPQTEGLTRWVYIKRRPNALVD